MILEKIPFTAERSNQSVSVTLAGIPFTIGMMWNTYGEYWSLSVAELNGDDLLIGIKAVPNYPLCGRFSKLGLIGDLYLIHRNGSDTPPTFEDLAVNYDLYYYDPEVPVDLPVPIPAVS